MFVGSLAKRSFRAPYVSIPARDFLTFSRNLSAGGPYPTIQSTSFPSLSTKSSVGVARMLNLS